MTFGEAPEAVVLVDEKDLALVGDDGAAGFFVIHGFDYSIMAEKAILKFQYNFSIGLGDVVN